MAMRSFLAAWHYLTIFGRLSVFEPRPAEIGRGTIYFPLVGFLLGLILALLNYALGLYLAPEILSLTLVAVLLVATGGRHLEGVKGTFDALAPKASDPVYPQTEAWGVAAIAFLIFFKTAAIHVMDDAIALSLLLTPLLARWILVLFLYDYRDRFEAGLRAIAERVGFLQLLATTALTVGAALYFIGRKGLWVAFVLSMFSLLLRKFLHRRHALLTQHDCGTAVELSEAIALILMASL